MSLKFSLCSDAPHAFRGDAVVVGVFDGGEQPEATRALDAALNGALSRLIESGDVSGKAGRTALLHGLSGMAAPRLLSVGLGKAADFSVAAFVKAASESAKVLNSAAAARVLSTLPLLAVPDRDAAWARRQTLVLADHAAYRYTATRKGGNDRRFAELCVPGDDAASVAQAEAIAAGVELARELGNLPPNICNPAYLAEQAQKLAAEHNGASCEVLERADMEALGMGSLLAVARGSANPPKLIVLRWNGGGEARPYALVGKGITFDTGGINLKVQGGIEEMKFDMCGAATVIGTFLTVAKLRLPINLVVIAAAVENMPDGDAYRPSDVLNSMSGKTIEVGNTDAEGRLILCDALTYVQRYEPVATVDVATLTGACMIALGKAATGLMSKHDDLAEELLRAGEQVHDRAWRLPLWDDYQPLLDSSFADVYNIGGRWAGAITAGCFLSRFTEGQRWAHLDIAGSGSDEGRKGMATGRPVGLLTEWLAGRSRDS
jgi:leucyl aminopeptidase